MLHPLIPWAFILAQGHGKMFGKTLATTWPSLGTNFSAAALKPSHIFKLVPTFTTVEEDAMEEEKFAEEVIVVHIQRAC